MTYKKNDYYPIVDQAKDSFKLMSVLQKSRNENHSEFPRQWPSTAIPLEKTA